MLQDPEEQARREAFRRFIQIAAGLTSVSLLGAWSFLRAGYLAFLPGSPATGFLDFWLGFINPTLRLALIGAPVTDLIVAGLGATIHRSFFQTFEFLGNIPLAPFRLGRLLFHYRRLQNSLKSGNPEGYKELAKEARRLARSNARWFFGRRSSATWNLLSAWATHYRHRTPTFADLQHNSLIRAEAARSIRNRSLTPKQALLEGYQQQVEQAARASQIAVGNAVQCFRNIARVRRQLVSLAEKREYHAQRVRNAAVALEAADIAWSTSSDPGEKRRAEQIKNAAEQIFADANQALANAEDAYTEKGIELNGKPEVRNEKGEVIVARAPGLLDREKDARREAREAIVAAGDAREARYIALKSYFLPLTSVHQPPGRKGILKVLSQISPLASILDRNGRETHLQLAAFNIDLIACRDLIAAEREKARRFVPQYEQVVLARELDARRAREELVRIEHEVNRHWNAVQKAADDFDRMNRTAADYPGKQISDAAMRVRGIRQGLINPAEQREESQENSVADLETKLREAEADLFASRERLESAKVAQEKWAEAVSSAENLSLGVIRARLAVYRDRTGQEVRQRIAELQRPLDRVKGRLQTWSSRQKIKSETLNRHRIQECCDRCADARAQVRMLAAEVAKAKRERNRMEKRANKLARSGDESLEKARREFDSAESKLIRLTQSQPSNRTSIEKAERRRDRLRDRFEQLDAYGGRRYVLTAAARVLQLRQQELKEKRNQLRIAEKMRQQTLIARDLLLSPTVDPHNLARTLRASLSSEDRQKLRDIYIEELETIYPAYQRQKARGRPMNWRGAGQVAAERALERFTGRALGPVMPRELGLKGAKETLGAVTELKDRRSNSVRP